MNSFPKRWVAAALFLICCQAGAAGAPLLPHVVGHRGLEHHLPENTEINFSVSFQFGLGVEVDVRQTADGVFVCMHDDTVDRTTTGTGLVAKYSYADLRALDAGSHQSNFTAGERVPPFSALLERLSAARNPNNLVLLDLKIDGEGVVEELVELVRKHGVLDQVVFIGVTIIRPDVRARLKAADPAVQIAALAQTAQDLPVTLRDPHANWAYLRFVPSAAEVAQIRAQGMRTVVVGAPVVGMELENWRKVKDAGVDALMTEYPLECRRALFIQTTP